MQKDGRMVIVEEPSLISFWDFQEEAGQRRVAKGPYKYQLSEMNGPIKRVNEGVFGSYSIQINEGQWLNLPRKECRALNIHGPKAEITVVAWVKRAPFDTGGCEAIAGIWNETGESRQYCLFLDLHIWDSKDQVCGHISSTGAPTTGYKWCMDAAIGETPVPKDRWQLVAFTYDGQNVKAYLNGKLDERGDRNPYYYPYGILNGGESGSDFTVAGVDRSGEMGNWYVGLIGGLAVFNKALSEEKVMKLYNHTLNETGNI